MRLRLQLTVLLAIGSSLLSDDVNGKDVRQRTTSDEMNTDGAKTDRKHQQQPQQQQQPPPHQLQPPLPSVWFTFSRPGSGSFVEYRQIWSGAVGVEPSSFGLRFAFRTLKANAFLLHHTFVHHHGVRAAAAAAAAAAATTTPTPAEVFEPEILVKLRNGMIYVSLSRQNHVVAVCVGRG